MDLADDGRGVAHLDGKRLFVPDALPGESVRVIPRRRRLRHEEAQLLEVLDPAPNRVVPACPYFGRCGGCVLQHLDPDAQLTAKAAHVARVLQRIGGVAPQRWLEPITGPHWNYRRRARLSVRYVTGKERVLVGFRERGHGYVTDMSQCAVLAKPADGLLAPLADLIHGTTLRQRLSQVEVAVGDASTALVLRALDPPSAADIDRFVEFGAAHDVDMLLQTAGPDSLAAVNSASLRPLYYCLSEFDVRLDFAPLDFIQINARVNEQMVSRVIQLLSPVAGDRVLDLFCGLGNFSLALARHAGEVLGVEGAASLVSRAAANATANQFSNARFLRADLSESGAPFAGEPWDLLVLDPPRSGALQIVADIKRMAPRAIAYVSCHPATLARDAHSLVHESGYRLSAAGVLDMFPHTRHVEVLALFEAQ